MTGLCRHAATGGAFLLPVLAVAAPKGLTPLLFLLAVLALAERVRTRNWRFPTHALAFAAVLPLWAALSALWALDGFAALATAGKLAAVLFAGLLLATQSAALSSETLVRAGRAFLAGFALAALYLLIETAGGEPVHRWVLEIQGRAAEFERTVTNRAVSLLFLMSWPAALILWHRRGSLVATLPPFIAMLVVALGVSRSAGMAIAAASLFALFAALPGRMGSRLLAAAMAAAILLTPLLPGTLPSPARLEQAVPERLYSAVHRLYIWEFAAERIAERPFAGWGMDAARRLPGGDQKLPQGGHRMNMHPHNAAVQTWLELGAPGAAWWFALCAGLLLLAGSGPPVARLCLTALVGGSLAIAHLSFGIWQTWWMSALVLLFLAGANARRLALSR